MRDSTPQCFLDVDTFAFCCLQMLSYSFYSLPSSFLIHLKWISLALKSSQIWSCLHLWHDSWSHLLLFPESHLFYAKSLLNTYTYISSQLCGFKATDFPVYLNLVTHRHVLVVQHVLCTIQIYSLVQFFPVGIRHINSENESLHLYGLGLWSSYFQKGLIQ